MRKYILLGVILICLIISSCGEKSENNDVRQRKALKSAQVKSLKLMEYTYQFGKPAEATAVTLLTCEYDKEGDITKEVHPKKILTFGYKDVDKKKRLSDIDELNSEYLLQFQTKIEYADKGVVTTNRYTTDGQLVAKKIANRDEYDRDTTVVEYDTKGVISSKSVFQYDESGLKKTVIYGAKDNILSKTVRISGNESRREYVTYNNKGVAQETFVEYYNKDNLLVEYENNTEDAALFRHFKRTYNNNLLDEEVEYMRNGEPRTMKKYFYGK